LDRDRWCYLAIRAYSRGLVTFTEEEKQDDRWKLREALMLGEVERDALISLHSMLHQQESAAAQYSGGNDIFKHYRDRAREQYVHFAKLALPYERHDNNLPQAGMDKLAEAWKELYGDPNDPEVAARIEQAIQDVAKSAQGEEDY